MPATTTLKLPLELKERITPLAESAGKSPRKRKWPRRGSCTGQRTYTPT